MNLRKNTIGSERLREGSSRKQTGFPVARGSKGEVTNTKEQRTREVCAKASRWQEKEKEKSVMVENFPALIH